MMKDYERLKEQIQGNLLAELEYVMRVTIENQMQQQERLRSNAVYASVLTDVVEGKKGDYITLDYVYSVKLPVGGFGFEKLYVRQRSMVHIFNGYDDSYGDCVGEQPEYVYVTSSGSVYHKKRSCRALQISVREVSGARVGDMRNKDRKIYRSCNICMKGYTKEEIRGQTVYITDYGDTSELPGAYAYGAGGKNRGYRRKASL